MIRLGLFLALIFVMSIVKAEKLDIGGCSLSLPVGFQEFVNNEYVNHVGYEPQHIAIRDLDYDHTKDIDSFSMVSWKEVNFESLSIELMEVKMERLDYQFKILVVEGKSKKVLAQALHDAQFLMLLQPCLSKSQLGQFNVKMLLE